MIFNSADLKMLNCCALTASGKKLTEVLHSTKQQLDEYKTKMNYALFSVALTSLQDSGNIPYFTSINHTVNRLRNPFPVSIE